MFKSPVVASRRAFVLAATLVVGVLRQIIPVVNLSCQVNFPDLTLSRGRLQQAQKSPIILR
jgi:hypothetical protein